jgi:PAS domain S-box-containing protein
MKNEFISKNDIESWDETQQAGSKGIEERYRSLFDFTPIGIYRTSPDGTFIEVNQTLLNILGYSSEEELLTYKITDLYVEEHQSDGWENLISSGGEMEILNVKFRREDGKVIWVNDTARAVKDANGTVLYYEGRIEDVTEQRKVEKALANHANELAAINTIAQKVHASLSIGDIVDVILKELKVVLDLDLVFLFLRERGRLNPAGHFSEAVELKDINEKWMEKCLTEISSEVNDIFYADDVQSDDQDNFREFKKVGIKSFISVPMHSKGKQLGVIVFASLTFREFSKEITFLEAMVSQVSIALLNAKIYQQALAEISEGKVVTGELSTTKRQLEEIVRKRTQELREQYQEIEKEVAERKKAELAEREQRTLAQALEETSSILTSTLDLDEVLDSILMTLGNVIPHDSANIMLIDEKENVASVARYKGNPKYEVTEKPTTSHFPIFETPTLKTMYQTRRPFVIPDVKSDSTWIDQIGSGWIGSYMATPILFGDEVLGFLNLVSDTPNFYSQAVAERLQAFANHASVAIRNARLFDQAMELAALEERQRLAREMHDAVSQTLFTANVIAEALPLQWERNPQKGVEGLQTIRRLIRGALAEVRTLLVELRPDAISKSDLGDLITQIAYGATSYSEIDLSLDISGRFPLPDNVQLEVFRIAQEVFNNIVKHARARHVSVEFKNQGDYLYLSIQDDGRGFNIDRISTGRLGIAIMRERAGSIGAVFNIHSRPKHGTTASVEWRDDAEKQDE